MALNPSNSSNFEHLALKWLTACMRASLDRVIVTPMIGVNHGGTGVLPPEFGVGDANANCPPDFVMFQHFKDRIACSTFTMQKTVMPTLPSCDGDCRSFISVRIHQNTPFLGKGLCQTPPWVARVPFPHPTPSSRQAFGIRPFVPPEFQADLHHW